MTKTMMLVAAAVLALGVSAAQAQDTCKAQAAEKKLAGAAKNSFLKKCGEDANKAVRRGFRREEARRRCQVEPHEKVRRRQDRLIQIDRSCPSLPGGEGRRTREREPGWGQA
jgi:hypothetical protein